MGRAGLIASSEVGGVAEFRLVGDPGVEIALRPSAAGRHPR
jgi:hypothetical protein